MKRLFLVIAALFLSTAAGAAEIASRDLLVPVVTRSAGGFGSRWQTDLVITNVSRKLVAVPVSVEFTAGDGSTRVYTTTLQPRSSVVLRDVVRETFGRDQGAGYVSISSPAADAQISARGRLYNVGGSSGEFGQTVPAVPLAQLARDAYLPGLSGVGANRSNVGISNPHAGPAVVTLSLYDVAGELRGSFTTSVAARSVRQFNDIFGTFGVPPFDGATVQVTSSSGVYAYASVVRSDSGDADFIAGIAPSTTGDPILPPPCANPAPIHLASNPAPGWIVIFKDGTNAAAEAARLAAKYNITPRVYEAVRMFYVETIAPEAIAGIRCEASVRLVEQNAFVVIP